MKSALDFLALQSFLNRELEDKQKEAVMQILCGGNLLTILPKGFGKSLIFQMVRLDRPCDLPVEKQCGAKRFLKVQTQMSNLKSSPLHPDLYAKANYFLVLVRYADVSFDILLVTLSFTSLLRPTGLSDLQLRSKKHSSSYCRPATLTSWYFHRGKFSFVTIEPALEQLTTFICSPSLGRSLTFKW